MATWTSHVLRKLSYEERLCNLSLTTLEARRDRGFLIQLFKIEKRIDEVELATPHIRGAPKIGYRGWFRKQIVQNCQQRSNIFAKRVVNNWNSIPDSVGYAPQTNAFKIGWTSSNNVLWKNILNKKNYFII